MDPLSVRKQLESCNTPSRLYIDCKYYLLYCTDAKTMWHQVKVDGRTSVFIPKHNNTSTQCSWSNQ